MARVNGRMFGAHHTGPSCIGGYGCCRIPRKSKRSQRQAELREEYEAAYLETDESHTGRNFEYENLTDPNWDGANDHTDLEGISGVKFIPAD